MQGGADNWAWTDDHKRNIEARSVADRRNGRKLAERIHNDGIATCFPNRANGEFYLRSAHKVEYPLHRDRGFPVVPDILPSHYAGDNAGRDFVYRLAANEHPRIGLMRFAPRVSAPASGFLHVISEGGHEGQMVGDHPLLTLRHYETQDQLDRIVRADVFRLDFNPNAAATMTLTAGMTFVATISIGDISQFGDETADYLETITVHVEQEAPPTLVLSLAPGEVAGLSRFTVSIRGGYKPGAENEPVLWWRSAHSQLDVGAFYDHSYMTVSSSPELGFEKGSGNEIVYILDEPEAGSYTIVVRASEEVPVNATVDYNPDVLITQVISVHAEPLEVATDVEFHSRWSTIPLGDNLDFVDLDAEYFGNAGNTYSVIGGDSDYLDVNEAGHLYMAGTMGIAGDTAYTITVSVNLRRGGGTMRQYAVRTGDLATGDNACPVVYERASGTYSDSRLASLYADRDADGVNLSLNLRYLVWHLIANTGGEDLSQYRRWRLYLERSVATRGFERPAGIFVTPDSTGGGLGIIHNFYEGENVNGLGSPFLPAYLLKEVTLGAGVTVAITDINTNNNALSLSDDHIYRVYRDGIAPVSNTQVPTIDNGVANDLFLAIGKGNSCGQLDTGEFYIKDDGDRTDTMGEAGRFHPNNPLDNGASDDEDDGGGGGGDDGEPAPPPPNN